MPLSAWLHDHGAINAFDLLWVLPSFDGSAGDVIEALRHGAGESFAGLVLLLPKGEADVAASGSSAAALRKLGLFVGLPRLA
jgi:hypothetical protein